MLHTTGCLTAQLCWLLQGVDFQPVQIDLSKKPAFYRSICNLVPVVSHCGQIIKESIDICKWVDGSLEGSDLSPCDEKQLVEMDRLISSSATVNSAGFDLLAGVTGRLYENFFIRTTHVRMCAGQPAGIMVL